MRSSRLPFGGQFRGRLPACLPADTRRRPTAPVVGALIAPAHWRRCVFRPRERFSPVKRLEFARACVTNRGPVRLRLEAVVPLEASRFSRANLRCRACGAARPDQAGGGQGLAPRGVCWPMQREDRELFVLMAGNPIRRNAHPQFSKRSLRALRNLSAWTGWDLYAEPSPLGCAA